MPSLLPDPIETKRLRLRRPDLSDAHAIFHGYTQDPDVCRFLVWTPHLSQSATLAFVESCIASWDAETRQPYVIAEKHSNVAIGMIEARNFGTSVDIGYVLAKTHWGRGFMTEALGALTDTALESSSTIYRVQATCDTENIASQRTLEKSGFSREARLERFMIHPNVSPEPRACFMYAKIR